MVKSLIKKGADVDLVSGQGYSPLLLATSLDQTETAQLLLVTGADANQADFDEKTPLHLAAGSGFGKVLLLLHCKITIILQPFSPNLARQNIG